MEGDFEKLALSRAILASLFSGLIATCIGVGYNIIYRSITHYDPSFIINTSSIIFGTVLPTVVAGILFYLCIRYINMTVGVIVFRVIFLILCVILGVAALHSNYGGGLPAYDGFKGLLLGLDIILGVFIVIFIPYFFTHHKIFMD